MAKVQTNLYFYHLGSSSWITDSGGHAIQHLQYLPFGELRVDQHTTSWNSRYTFSAKEKDEESGYGYFGARYLDCDLSIWLSVDPMAGKRPHQSPFAYCSNHPVNRIDPSGMLDGNFIDENGTILGNDGKTDGEVYVVPNKTDQAKISSNDAKGETTQVSEVNSALQLPSAGQRSEMLDGLIAADNKNPYAENGGAYGINLLDGNAPMLIWADQGKESDPCVDNFGSINLTAVVKDGPAGFQLYGTFHSHNSLVKKCGAGFTGRFEQVPSKDDFMNAGLHRAYNSGMSGPDLQFGMRSQKVNMYNASGIKAAISFDIFRNAR